MLSVSAHALLSSCDVILCSGARSVDVSNKINKEKFRYTCMFCNCVVAGEVEREE